MQGTAESTSQKEDAVATNHDEIVQPLPDAEPRRGQSRLSVNRRMSLAARRSRRSSVLPSAEGMEIPPVTNSEESNLISVSQSRGYVCAPNAHSITITVDSVVQPARFAVPISRVPSPLISSTVTSSPRPQAFHICPRQSCSYDKTAGDAKNHLHPVIFCCKSNAFRYYSFHTNDICCFSLSPSLR